MATKYAESQDLESAVKELTACAAARAPVGEQEAILAVRILLGYAGEDLCREGLRDTPKRVVNALRELLSAEEPKITVFEAKGYDQMIIQKEIPYYTLCEHHMLPFFGTVKVGYLPDKRIVGISKLSRIVEFYSHRLNTQEYFTENIANYLNRTLEPRGVGVVVTGRHLCQEMRGIRKQAELVTSALRGYFLSVEKAKEEFLSL